MKSIDRLYEYFKEKELNVSQLERACELSKSYFRTQKTRGADIGSTILGKIVNNCADLNLVWLVTGEGEMLIQDEKGLKRENLELKNFSRELKEEVDERDKLLKLAQEIIEVRNKTIAELEAQLNSSKTSA